MRRISASQHRRGLVVAAHYALPDVNPLLRPGRPALALTFGAADEHVEFMRNRIEPSMVAVVSVSEGFLRTASRVLATAAGSRHTIQQFLLPLPGPKALSAVDVVFADSIAVREIRHRNIVPYRIIAPGSLAYLAGALSSPNVIPVAKKAKS